MTGLILTVEIADVAYVISSNEVLQVRHAGVVWNYSGSWYSKTYTRGNKTLVSKVVVYKGKVEGSGGGKISGCICSRNNYETSNYLV